MKKVISGLAVLLIVALVGFKYYQYKHPETFPEPVTQTTTSVTLSAPASGGTSATAEAPATTNSTVDVHVTVPMNNVVRKGVVEVGASGFNSFVVNIDHDKNWELVSKQFGKSLAYEGFATEDDVLKGLKDYIADIADKGVKGSNIHFVMSSGALKNPKTKLIAQAIRNKGWVVNEVTADQEGKYALRATLPPEYKNNSFVVDIGSGNTKISWYEGDNLRSVEASGAKYVQLNKTDADVYNEIVTAVSKIPADHRTQCFIIGGVPFSLAKQVRNGEDRFTKLSPPDYYNAGDDMKMKAGINIYRALYEGSKTNTFIFDWDANFTIGFLMALN